MFGEEINKVGNAGEAKAKLLKNNPFGYTISSALAGIYVGIGIILIFTVGGFFNAANSPATKVLMGASFGIALSLVIMAGSELFTGNNMVMTVSYLDKKTTWGETFKVWIVSYVGNFIGSALLALMYVKSGLASGPIASFIVKTTETKMNLPWDQLLYRGILCNLLVCLAVWCSFKMKEEASKLIMIFWCLFAFITAGFEHSVANMTLLSIGLLIPHSGAVTVGGLFHNLIFVSIGNMIGGIVFVALAYFNIAKQRK